MRNITAKSLNGINIDDYLTTSTDQNISSSIEFNRIYGENIFADEVNDLKLENVSVPFDSNVTVNGKYNINEKIVNIVIPFSRTCDFREGSCC